MVKITAPDKIIEESNYVVLVYGRPGMGKTTLALTAKKPLLIDFDGGAKRAESRFLCPTIIQEETIDEKGISSKNNIYKDTLDFFRDDATNSQFSTVIIDTLGRMIESMSDYLASNDPKFLKSDGAPTLASYGLIAREFKRFISEAKLKNKNIIFISHTKEKKVGDDNLYGLDVVGSSKNEIVKDLDLMGFMDVIDGKRVIDFNVSSKFDSKGNSCIADPINIPALDNLENFFEEKIIGVVSEQKKKSMDMQKKKTAIVDVIKKDISALMTAEEYNSFIKSYKKTYEMFWDIELVLKRFLIISAVGLNLEFDKIKKEFKNGQISDNSNTPK